MDTKRYNASNGNIMNDRRSFYRNYSTVQVKKGETIFLQDNVPKCLYSIKSGVVEEYNITANGNFRSISFEVTGDIIPKCWTFSRTTNILFYYRAHTDCELYVIDKKSFLLHLVNDIDFTNKMLSRAMNSLIGARLHIDALEKSNASAKLLYMFRYFCITYGKEIEDDIVKIPIPLTQQEIANFIGLTRETTTLKIDQLKNNKVVFCTKKYYSVDMIKLNDLIENECDAIDPTEKSKKVSKTNRFEQMTLLDLG